MMTAQRKESLEEKPDVNVFLPTGITKNIPSYLKQIQECISAVYQEEQHLIEFPEIINSYFTLSDPAKLLFIRLLNRNHNWIRVNSLATDHQVGAIDLELVAELEDSKLVHYTCCKTLHQSEINNVKEFLAILNKNELLSLVKTNYSNPQTGLGSIKKEALQDLLLQQARLPSISKTQAELDCLLIRRILEQTGPIVKQSTRARRQFHHLFVIYQRMQALPDKDTQFMTSSILANLQDVERKQHYVSVNLNRSGLVWPCLTDFKEYMDALYLEKEILMMHGENNQDGREKIITIYNDTIRPKWSTCINDAPEEGHITGIQWFSTFTAAHVYTRILSYHVYHAYFRLKDYPNAISVLKSLISQRKYHLTKRGFWYDELARLVENYVSKEEARSVCKEALSDTWVITSHRNSLFKRLENLYKNSKTRAIILRERPVVINHTKVYIQGDQVKRDEKQGVFFKSKLDSQVLVRVEQYALEYYSQLGWKGFHSENSIILTLFGLLFWDCLFDDSVPGVFTHPFQTHPLDLKTPYFYISRKEKIDGRLEEIHNGMASYLIQTRYQQESSKRTKCIGVNWDFQINDVLEIVDCIGAHSLARICRVFATTFWSHLGGVPDLCLWNPKTRSFRLSEVKSENDRLSDRQIVWLSFLDSVGVSCEVAHVGNHMHDQSQVSKKRKR